MQKRRLFVDLAANLTDSVFRGVDLKGRRVHEDDFSLVLQRAKDAGVAAIVVSGTSLEVSRQAVELCKANPGFLFCTVGIHPTHADEFILPSRVAELRAAAPKLSAKQRKKAASTQSPAGLTVSTTSTMNPAYADSGASMLDALLPGQQDHTASVIQQLRLLVEQNRQHVVAIGETGLDYAELNSLDAVPGLHSRQLQREAFEAQLRLASEVRLPLFLHSRDSGLAFVEVLEQKKHSQAGGLVHSFNGSREERDRVLAAGFDIGINSSAFRSEQTADGVLGGKMPLNRLHIETDAPWCDVRRDRDFGARWIETWPQTMPRTAFQAGACVERRNEPCHVVQVAEQLRGFLTANRSGEEKHDLTDQLLANALRVFPGLRGAALLSTTLM